MRLPSDVVLRSFALGVTVLLAGCGLAGGGERPAQLAAAPTGPAADYPMVLGDPFTVDGEVYTPADTMNYDAVGYAALDDGAGVSVADRTLPLPSYVEVTSLDSGKTILARVERRGPMTGSRLVALSHAAAAQLGVGEGAAVRVRRVNPPEAERAELRAGRPAPERMETPKSLVEVLRRKLPGRGSLNLGAPAPRQAAAAAPAAVATAPRQPAPRVAAARPLPPLPAKTDEAKPAVVASASLAPAAKPQPAAEGRWVVQAATFASNANAKAAAAKLGGVVSPAGKYFRVRTGPFSTRGQAEAALAKVRAAGYSDAKIFTAG
jgi:rare lipoprotein A